MFIQLCCGAPCGSMKAETVANQAGFSTFLFRYQSFGRICINSMPTIRSISIVFSKVPSAAISFSIWRKRAGVISGASSALTGACARERCGSVKKATKISVETVNVTRCVRALSHRSNHRCTQNVPKRQKPDCRLPAEKAAISENRCLIPGPPARSSRRSGGSPCGAGSGRCAPCPRPSWC